MTKTDKSRIYSIIGAVIFTLLGCYNILGVGIHYIRDFSDLHFEDIPYIVFGCGVPIGFGVSLFLREKKGVLIVSAVKAALILYALFQIFNIYNVFYFAVYVGLVCVSAFAVQRNNIVKNIWFIPTVLLCVQYLMSCAAYNFLMFGYLIEAVQVLFIGLWLREDVISHIAEKEPKVNNPDSLIGGADRLKACKELLDSGVITQEEFETKRKQILEKY